MHLSHSLSYPPSPQLVSLTHKHTLSLHTFVLPLLFLLQVIQVHETQLVRHGMMVVGESGSGKSTNVKVLAKALTTLFEDKVVDKDGFYKQVDCLILNPKSITAGELYGEFNLMTNEWKVNALIIIELLPIL